MPCLCCGGIDPELECKLLTSGIERRDGGGGDEITRTIKAVDTKTIMAVIAGLFTNSSITCFSYVVMYPNSHPLFEVLQSFDYDLIPGFYLGLFMFNSFRFVFNFLILCYISIEESY